MSAIFTVGGPLFQVRGGASPFDAARGGRLGMPRGTHFHPSRWRGSRGSDLNSTVKKVVNTRETIGFCGLKMFKV